MAEDQDAGTVRNTNGITLPLVPEVEEMETSSTGAGVGLRSPIASQNEMQPGGEVAIPDTESEVGLVNPSARQSTPSEVVVAGGSFTNAILGPQTNKNRYEARKYVNSMVNEVHHHYHDSSGGNQDASSSSHRPAKRKRYEEETEDLEEGYIRICDDTIMCEEKPLREGTNVYWGYQEHVSEDGVPNTLPVAIKRIVPSNEKHKKEVQHLVTLASHPNVVRIIRSKEHKTPHARVLYIVMELCSHLNLHDFLTKNRENGTPFDFKQALAFTKQLLNGMKHIHDNRVVHRDVKPENVLLATDKTLLKYSDFGLGKELRQGRSSTKVTVQGQGTEGYRAPETHFSKKVSKSADIFSLAITIFGLWSGGGHPFGADILLRDHNIVSNSNHDFSSLLITGSLREDFLDLMRQMLQHDPALRPTIDEVLAHIFFRNAAIPSDSLRLNGCSDHNEPEAATSPSQNNMIQHYRNKGQVKRCFGKLGKDPGCLNFPHGIAVTSDDEILVVAMRNDMVQVFDPSGNFIRQFGHRGSENGEFKDPRGICVTKSNQIIVADGGNGRVQVFDNTGRFIRAFGRDELQSPWSVAVNNDGLVFVADDRNSIKIFSLNGDLMQTFGRSWLDSHGWIKNITVTNDNKVILAETKAHRIGVFDESRQFMFEFGRKGSGEGQFESPHGVTSDQHGNIIISDSENNRIQVFDKDGNFISSIGSKGSEPGQLNEPWGVAVLRNGDIVVSDKRNDRIQIF